MPFVFDFNNGISDKLSVEVSPKGWVLPLTVEYTIAQAHKYDTTLSVVWRVKGTTHTFTIGEQKINALSNGDYKKHFTDILEGFRKDYLSWFKEDTYKDAEWKYEYEKQFGNLIIPDE